MSLWRHPRRLLLALVLHAVSAPLAVAQAGACHIDSATAIDTARGFLVLRRALTADTTQLLPLLDHQLAAQEIATRFHAPTTVTFSPWTGIIPPRPALTASHRQIVSKWMAPGMLAIVFDEAGHLSAASWLRLPASFEIGAGVLQALAAATGSISVDIAHARKPPHLWLDMDFVDSIPPGAVPLMRLAVPALRADRGAEAIDRPFPEFPRSGVKSWQGYADIVGIIGEDGRPDASTLHILFATEPPFGVSAYNAVMHTRFRPATLQGCAVAVPFVERYRFVMER